MRCSISGNTNNEEQKESPISILPAEMLSKIFGFFTLSQLLAKARVSKFWKQQIEADIRWNSITDYFKECTAITGKKIEFIDAQEIMKRLNTKLKSRDDNIFSLIQEVIDTNDLEMMQVILKDKLIDVEHTFKISISLKGKTLTYSKITMLYYAVLVDKPEMVRLLLLHKADVTKEACISPQEHQDIKLEVLGDPFINLSSLMSSILSIANAEHELAHDQFENIISYFVIASQKDINFAKQYIQQVQQTKVGFIFEYNEEILAQLSKCFDWIIAGGSAYPDFGLSLQMESISKSNNI